MASASACLAGLLKRMALSCQSFDNVSLAVAMTRGIKATLLCAHDRTVLTNPEPCSSPPALRVHSNQAHPRRVSMPSCNSDALRTGIFIAGSPPTVQLSPRWTTYSPKIQCICDNPLSLSMIHPCTASRRPSKWRFWSS